MSGEGGGRHRPLLTMLLVFGVAGLAVGAWLWAGRAEPRRLSASLSVAETLRGRGAEGFARALAPRAFSFPADHGPHPEFRTEWWYYTGNLTSRTGRRFGFQLTFFRNALTPEAPARRSAWAARDVYLAHFALTDVAGETFLSAERVSRAALDLAGARAEPFRVWLGTWSAEGPPTGGGAMPMRLRAEDSGVALDLSLHQGKPPVLQGERGLSRKGAEPGQASYYYSLTRMPAAGTIRLGRDTFEVSGLAWMDREWSTSSLSAGQVGWDWFALQLEDGRELMLYFLRRADGSADPASGGTLVGPEGEALPLTLADVRVEVLDRWRSPGSGARYPSRWRLRIPKAGLDLEVRPLLADQELATSFRYWEGAVAVAGNVRSSRGHRGSGYVELTGYADAAEEGATR